MTQQEKEFINGLIFKDPSENAPEFVLGSLSAKREELITYLQSKEEEWLNMKVLRSRGGKPYIELDTWKPEKKEETVQEGPKIEYPSEEIDPADIPF